MVFNASRVFVRQLKKGDNYTLLNPVYGLAILNDYMQPKDITTSFYHHYKTVNIENTNDVIPGLEFVLVELPKFEPVKIADRKMAVLWLRFLKEVGEDGFKADSDMTGNDAIREAIEICAEGGFTPEELETYEDYWDIIRTNIAVNIASFADGEWNKAVQVVIDARKAGLPVDTIAAITRLTPGQVIAILKEHGFVE
jgi:hypothetical protein